MSVARAVSPYADALITMLLDFVAFTERRFALDAIERESTSARKQHSDIDADADAEEALQDDENADDVADEDVDDVADDAADTTLVTFACRTKRDANSHLLRMMRVVATFANPTTLRRADELRALYLRLLTRADVGLQVCVCTLCTCED
jgi:hypothetical protein